MLHGPVQLIDGKRAPNTSKPVAVAAGCHIIRTGRTEIVMQRIEVELRLWTTPVDIHISVAPGHKYLIEHAIGDQSASFSTVVTTIREEDASGRTMGLFVPLQNAAAPGPCRPLVKEAPR